MRILVFDTETTGLPIKRNGSIDDSSNWPFIIQISWVIYDTYLKRNIEEYDQYIRLNGITISEKSIEIHGITEEVLENKGICIKIALEEFRKAILKCDLLVGHNIDFDKKIILAEGYRNGVEILFDKKEYCTMKRGSKGQYLNLGKLYEKLFGVLPDNLHNSKRDVEVCLQCFLEMKKNRH